MPRLPDDAIAAGGIDRAQDRSDVVRILDAVEHDDERRPRRADHQILDAEVRRGILHVGDDALVHAAARRESIELVGLHATHRNALLLRQRDALRRAARRRAATRGSRSRVPRAAPRATGLMP